MPLVGFPGLPGSPSLVLDEPELTHAEQKVVLAIALLAAQGRAIRLNDLIGAVNSVRRFRTSGRAGVAWHLGKLRTKGVVAATAGFASIRLARVLRFREVLEGGARD